MGQKQSLNDIVKPIGTIEREEFFVTVYNAQNQPMYSFCTVDRSVKIFDKGKIIFEVEPQLQGKLQITNKTKYSEDVFADYLNILAEQALSMTKESASKDETMHTYLSAYHVLTDTAQRIINGAYMRAEKKDE